MDWLNIINLKFKSGDTVKLAATTDLNIYESAQVATAITVNAGQNINIQSNGGTTGTINVTAPTGSITINDSQSILVDGTGGAITTTGGTAVAITSTTSGLTATPIATTTFGRLGAITETGTAATTSVSVTESAGAKALATAAAGTGAAAVVAQVGTVLGAVTITDANATSPTIANTIATVNVTNAANVTINSNALTTLNLSGTFDASTVITNGTVTSTAATITINNTATTPTNTTLALGLTGVALSAITNNSSTAPTIVDTNSEITTINANLGSNSKLTAITDSKLATLNVGGTGVLTLTTANPTLKTVTLSGAAGLNTNLSSTLVTAIDAGTTTGAQTLTLNPTTQSFTGGTGRDIITIALDATKTIKGGSATNTEIVLNGAASTFTAANTLKNVTGFTVLGTNSGTSGTFDQSIFTGFNALDVLAGTVSVGFSKVASNIPLTINGAATSVSLTVADSNGITDTQAVTLGNATSTQFTVGALSLTDAAANGIGIVNLVSTGLPGTAGAQNTITTLTDTGLSTLNVSGSNGLVVTNAVTSTANVVTLNNNSSVATGTLGLSLVAGLTDNSLTNLNLTGSGATTIGTLTDTTSSSISINDSATAAVTITAATVVNSTNISVVNSGSAALTIATLTDSAATTETFTNSGTSTLTIGGTAHPGTALTTINYNGNVADTITADAVTTAITVKGATNNANVSLTFTGITAAGVTDTITLGNGVDTVIFSAASLGTHNVTLGNGAGNTFTENTTIVGNVNLTLGTGNTTVTFGTAATMTTGFINVTAP